MKYSRLLSLFIICLIALLISSCGDSRENEASENEGASQIDLYVGSGGSEAFITDEGYSVALTSGRIYLSDILIAGEGGGGHTHEHSIKPEEPTEGSSCRFHGPYEVNLTLKRTKLGLKNTDPGTYSHLSFEMSEHHHDKKEAKKHHETLLIEGIAVKDSIDYPFCVALEMDGIIELDNFSVELGRGHYGRLQLFLGVHHWLNGVDIEKAPQEEGIFYINSKVSPELAEKIMSNVRTHVRVDILDD